VEDIDLFPAFYVVGKVLLKGLMGLNPPCPPLKRGELCGFKKGGVVCALKRGELRVSINAVYS